MKLSWGVVISSLYCSASAASSAGRVFIFDPLAAKTAPQQSSVEPETARLIFAQRLGVSQYHSIVDPSEEAVRQINAFGGRRRKLFGDSDVDEKERIEARLLVWIEDVEDVNAIITDPSAYSAQFAITTPPSKPDNNRLFNDLVLQAEALPTKPDPLGRTFSIGVTNDDHLRSLKKPEIHNEYLTVFHADKTDELKASRISQSLTELLTRSIDAKERGWPITVVLMPPSSAKTKRSAYPYGTYDLPSVAEARQKTEALLSPLASQPSDSPYPDIPDFEDMPKVQQISDKSPVLGILPLCFSSQNACEKQTHNCSSHGSCTLSRKGDGKGKTDCYACKCEAHVEFVGGGGMEEKPRTTYWGGPACQKKDISIPFFLFVGTGVLLAFLISAGIGLLYSMGAEELPSVIGAGVSGPARK